MNSLKPPTLRLWQEVDSGTPGLFRRGVERIVVDRAYVFCRRAVFLLLLARPGVVGIRQFVQRGAPPLRGGFTRAVPLSPSWFGPFVPFLLAHSCSCATLTYRLCKMSEASLGVRIPAPPCLEGYPQGWRTPIPPHQTDSIDISARDRDWIRIQSISLSKISNPRARVGIEKDEWGDEAPSGNT